MASLGAAEGAIRARITNANVGIGALRGALREGADDFMYKRTTQRAARGELDRTSDAAWSAARGAVLGGVDAALKVASSHNPGDGATRERAISAAMKGALTGAPKDFINEKLAQRDALAGTKRWYVARRLRRAAVGAAVDFVATNVRAEYNKDPRATSAKVNRSNLRTTVPVFVRAAVEETRRTLATMDPATMDRDPYSGMLFGARRASYV
jgi:hypothetical protein